MLFMQFLKNCGAGKVKHQNLESNQLKRVKFPLCRDKKADISSVR